MESEWLSMVESDERVIVYGREWLSMEESDEWVIVYRGEWRVSHFL